MKKLINSILIATLAFSSIAISSASDEISTLRDDTKIDEQKKPNAIYKVNNDDIKKQRNYPMQPPIIPHTTRNYEVNLNSNKCMVCHSRQRTQDTQATMVSVTHYMDREGNFLAEISPRRYFCNQCHVTQKQAKPLVDNEFTDMYKLMKEKSEPK